MLSSMDKIFTDTAKTIFDSIDHYREAGRDDNFNIESIAELLERRFVVRDTVNVEFVYVLEYTKYFKSGEVTKHFRRSLSQDTLFDYMTEFCDNSGLVLVKSDKPEDEFLFYDGDWVYFGESEFFNVRFFCHKDRLL
jgi:hypothetical protein